VSEERPITVGLITGTGTYRLPGLDEQGDEEVATPWGDARVTRGRLGDVEVAHLSRHGVGHARLSNHVAHRANVAALRSLGADAVLAVTVCGAVDPGVELGSLIVFDDLHFTANRLADGSLCTLYDEPGDRRRGHWIFDRPFSPDLRRVLLDSAVRAGTPARDGGCYGHVDGPRFNSRAEIRGLASCGVTAVSQTAGPEAVLCGEAELPYALLGYATDYANGVSADPTPVDELLRRIAASTDAFARVVAEALPALARGPRPAPPGTVYRFEG
jgi:purine nucleoside phosphorylase